MKDGNEDAFLLVGIEADAYDGTAEIGGDGGECFSLKRGGNRKEVVQREMAGRKRCTLQNRKVTGDFGDFSDR
jgi:hypothetical protein